jgi:hypothetical protein
MHLVTSILLVKVRMDGYLLSTSKLALQFPTIMNTVEWAMRLAVLACAMAIIALAETAKAAKSTRRM